MPELPVGISAAPIESSPVAPPVTELLEGRDSASSDGPVVPVTSPKLLLVVGSFFSNPDTDGFVVDAPALPEAPVPLLASGISKDPVAPVVSMLSASLVDPMVSVASTPSDPPDTPVLPITPVIPVVPVA